MNGLKKSINFDIIKRGDLIFTRSEDWTGKFIRFVIRSQINHVAIYLGNNQLIEAQLGFGVRHVELSSYVNDKKCEVYFGSLLQINDEQIEKSIENAENLLNKPYDLVGQVGILFKVITIRVGLGKLVKFFGNNITKTSNAYWCSELVAKCYEGAGVSLSESDSRYATPEDLAKSSMINFKILE